MYDSYNYPPGADNEWAPWNEPSTPEIDVDVCVSTTLSKSDTLYTTDYNAEYWQDCEPDDEGGMTCTGGVDYDFSDTNFVQAYKDNCYSIPQLLEKLIELAKDKIEDIEENGVKEGGARKYSISYLKSIIEDAEGWTEDELEVVKDD